MRRVLVSIVVLGIMGVAWVAFAATTARARANLRDGFGSAAGYVTLTELAGTYLNVQMNVSGQTMGLAEGSQYGMYLLDGPCPPGGSGFGPPPPHLAVTGETEHLLHTGDLPNIRGSSTGAFSLTKATSRFNLSSPALSIGNASGGGTVSVGIWSGPDGSEGSLLLCGELFCEQGSSCNVGGAN